MPEQINYLPDHLVTRLRTVLGKEILQTSDGSDLLWRLERVVELAWGDGYTASYTRGLEAGYQQRVTEQGHIDDTAYGRLVKSVAGAIEAPAGTPVEQLLDLVAQAYADHLELVTQHATADPALAEEADLVPASA